MIYARCSQKTHVGVSRRPFVVHRCERRGGVDLSGLSWVHGIALRVSSACDADFRVRNIRTVLTPDDSRACTVPAGASGAGGKGDEEIAPHNGTKLRAQVARCRCVRVVWSAGVVSPGRRREGEKERERERYDVAPVALAGRSSGEKPNRLNRSGGLKDTPELQLISRFPVSLVRWRSAPRPRIRRAPTPRRGATNNPPLSRDRRRGKAREKDGAGRAQLLPAHYFAGVFFPLQST